MFLNQIKHLLFIIVIMAMTPGVLWAEGDKPKNPGSFSLWTKGDKSKIPESIPGVKTVNAKSLLNMLVDDKDLMVFDARILKGREKGYIENSIHMPDIETDCSALSKMVTDLSSPVAFYCTSSKCGRSLNAVRIAQQCGFSNLFWFRGGFEDWKAQGYPYLI